MAAGICKVKGKGFKLQFTYDKRRYAVYGKTQSECREKQLKKIEDLKRQAETDKPIELDLDSYFEQWMANKAGSVKETTLRGNRIMYKNIGGVEIGGRKLGTMRLSEIDSQMVKALQMALIGKGKSTRTTNDTVSMLSSILESALNERLIEWNPAKAIKALKRTETTAAETIHRALTKQETDAFMNAAKDSFYYNLYRFLLHTGCRIGETGALTVFDIHNDGVQINKTITRTETGSYIIGKGAKTDAGVRFIPLDDVAADAIKNQQITNASFYPKSADMPIFRTVRGTLLKASIINTDIEKICKKAGIKRFSVHAFRDTLATRCVESGMEVKQLQSILGHRDISMTLGLYAHSDDKRKAEQLKAVNF